MKKHDGDNRRTVLIVSVVCFFLAIAAVAALFTFAQRREDSRRVTIDFSQEVRVENGAADPGMGEWELSIAEGGSYRFYVNWQIPNHTFITGCVIKDGEGKVLFAVTGGSVEADSIVLDLEAGVYRVEMHYLANEEDYIRFIKDYIGYTNEVGEFLLDETETSGVRSVNCTVEARGASAFNWYAMGVGAGILMGLLCVAVILAWTKKGRSVKCQFDERQELIRGRGAKYGFFTLLFCNLVMFTLELAEVPIFADTEVLTAMTCLIGICVYVVYCIWHEGYFALNENRGRLIAVFAVITILNFACGAMNIAHGEMIEDGRLTFRCINLLCGIVFLVIFATMLLKKICEDRKDESV